MTAVVIEDVEQIRTAMVDRLTNDVEGVAVVGHAGSVVEGIKVIQQTNPEVLFLDIELPDGTAFDILDIVQKPVHVVFITGSREYAIRAFKYSAIDYLLKPVGSEDVQRVVAALHASAVASNEQITLLKDVLENKRARIALHTQDRIIIVTLDEIVRCEADGNYTRFILSESRPVLVARTLKEYDNMLSSEGFMRVHQSHLINLSKVREFVKTDGGYLVMSDGSKVSVSTRKRSEVTERLSSLG